MRLTLGDDTLTVSSVASAARNDPQLGLSAEAAARMDDSVALRDELIATKRPLYGVTTGFGDSARFQLNPRRTAELQRNLIRYHLNGTGTHAAPDVVRATMLIRANCLARGYSGIRREVVDLLVDCLRHDILPLIPERGSVGASGDLVPLCYLADMLTGDGEVTFKQAKWHAADALRACGLKPATYEAKEGLALINGTSFMSGFAALAAHDAAELARVAELCTAMSAEALLGNRGHYHPVIHRQKPHRGQVLSAQRIHGMLAGSYLCTDDNPVLEAHADVDKREMLTLNRSIQDRYSLRCAPHVIGVLRDTLGWVTEWIEVEINSTNDNPLFDAETGEVYNGGNFYGGHIGQAMDSLKVAVASVGDLLDRQLALLVDDKFNAGLPPNLTPLSETGLHHGFKGMQLACSALTAEALSLTGPATSFSRSTESHNQDKVSMGTIAARGARTVVELVTEITAITLLAGCQAADLRGRELLGDGTRAAHRLLREHVPFLHHDRRLDGDLATVAELIASGAFTPPEEDDA
ncbi:aromatic amino acid lyase [Amycolatopsis sp. NPDC059657]|uniref:aromatic amino acid lyase n=1 Tax=Amycolatopsis sp. NPDC059657 TaxID=3346899 RepID=UPI0036728334